MTFNIITIFPHIFDSYFNESIIKRAQKNKLIKIKIHDLRQWADGRHKTIDDAPYGGGAGMVMRVEPIYKALQRITHSMKHIAKTSLIKGDMEILKSKVILLSAKGKRWSQPTAKKYSQLDNIILICGRYEGIDERVKKFVDEEISIGDYVLTGGEIGAMAIVDSIARLLPGVLGNATSALDESHSIPGLLEYPQYTRPNVFSASLLISPGYKKKKLKVPPVLLSGNHKKIKEWRKKKMKKI